MKSDVELLAPAGDFETALAAFAAGADAVYCGLGEFSARAFAKNLSFEELDNLVRYARGSGSSSDSSDSRDARRSGRKVYVTFNTIVDEDNIEAAIEQLARLEEIGPDALIIQDLGVARLCRKHFPGLVLHASTQLVAHNLEGVLALRELGFTRVVLARELSLEEIVSIRKRCGGLELECFIHGALCYSISGLCLFSAMEKDRSGNRGRCAYCCRQACGAPLASGEKSLPFSMKDLRLGEDVRKLVEAGVASLKIEGRMKSALYVASVTKYYRNILNTEARSHGVDVTVSDLETVFSRRTTQLYFDGRRQTFEHSEHSEHSNNSPIDPTSLGHLGTEIGTVKRITRDRDGVAYLRFHTARALEKHDGLQFEAMIDGKHLGMGISEMRPAISRHPVFEIAAGSDVEVRLPDEGEVNFVQALKPGMKIYCSMSNAVKRLFPVPAFRKSDYPGTRTLNLTVTLAADGVSAAVTIDGEDQLVRVAVKLDAAKNPEKTFAAVEKAFSKLGETDYRLGTLSLNDPDRLFAPMSVLNDLRRDLVETLDAVRDRRRQARIAAALADTDEPKFVERKPVRRIRLNPNQKLPSGAWDEVILAIDAEADSTEWSEVLEFYPVRLALPVYTSELDFNRLRNTVKRLLREGYKRWEASDLATLRMLKTLGVTDITADWTLYAFNSHALADVFDLGVKRLVASPENTRENLQYLAESGYDVEFLEQQSTPLFISLTEPATETPYAVYRRHGLWVTTKPVPRTFDLPEGVSTRLDLSWDPE